MTFEAPEASSDKAIEQDESLQDFSTFNLDPRIMKVLQKNNIKKPTLIQEKAIPLALEGKDLLAKAKTGSGKTLAYLLPILQRLLQLADANNGAGVKALILVPTKELARQVTETTQGLLYYFPKSITCINVAGEESIQLQRSILSSRPTIIVTTPSRILPHLDTSALSLEGTLEFLVVDEADLVLSFGYAQDVERLAQRYIPKTVQTFLMSATLTTEMEQLRQLVLRNPVTLKLEEGVDDENSGKLHQFILRCKEEDKFLLMYVTLKLKLLKGKILIFANDVERCFKLKLFLEQFGIRTCILNPELPAASRHHIVEEYNRGVYDIIIAGDTQTSSGFVTGSGSVGQKAKRMKVKSDKEGGVSRGVDFKHVDVVLNFDLPLQVDSYIHRIGRTARGGNSGTAISFISSPGDEKMLSRLHEAQTERGQVISDHDFDVAQLNGFRYRCQDAYRAITKSAIKQARLAAVKDEIAKSEKLKSFFEERPKDLQLLRHDANSGVVKSRPHLKHVPDYLLTTESQSTSGKIEALPQAERENTTVLKRRFNGKQNRKHRGKDPLRNIKRK